MKDVNLSFPQLSHHAVTSWLNNRKDLIIIIIPLFKFDGFISQRLLSTLHGTKYNNVLSSGLKAIHKSMFSKTVP
jgi:hypothetical protein